MAGAGVDARRVWWISSTTVHTAIWTHALFTRSIAAITPWFARFAELGHTHADKPAAEQIRIIRPMGIACEQAMYAATCGVNTHKGGILPSVCCALPPDVWNTPRLRASVVR